MMRFALSALALLLPVTTLAQIDDSALPAPIVALEDRGATIGETFEAPGELTGYTVSFQGQTLAAYVTPDREHVLVGTLLDDDGTNLSQPILSAAANAPRPESEWEAISDAGWIADGSDDAERVIYAFTDPNCPYCSRFYDQSRDWVESGDVQIRHVMVGVLREDSLGKAATLLADDDPSAALATHEARFDQGGVAPADPIPESTASIVEANNQLMSRLGIRGTPSVYYRDQDGEIRLARGLPRDDRLIDVMGGARPE
ncbi:thiol:disulfide interchange protein DsbG [Spiribacter vilamensis]|uniref:Thiol:disulfide interchange protein n=1 Tax=Spiribacter vilamensis TaxID=531306 RepID=A0A4Q8CYH5_9GAMM|nr:thiol:disulfide interchange protein DsbG [Spiribacter vilamensis]RZU98039.1 thiol:disulfide interchange protein DsbC [Spiribacter vilamensis]TVO61056.1 thiol:disulfide interchange protein DsbG [Spiribacter vilamensis]